MISKLRALLDQLASRLRLTGSLLARAQRRYAKFHKRAYVNHRQALEAEEAADRLRAKGHPVKGAAEDKRAGRCHYRAYQSSKKAQFWLGRVKVLTQQQKNIETRVEHVQEEVRQLSGVHIEGNHAKGGTPRERWLAVCLASVANCANGKRRNFYSQAGDWDVDHVIAPGEKPGERSDCSSTVTGWAKAAGLEDPNGTNWTGGYTGTLILAAGPWKQVSLQEMIEKGWGYIVYGSGTGHHTEAYTPSESDRMRTSGHGSAPVDFGTVHLFGAGEVERYFVYEGGD